jgi:hypothetical protein
MSTSVLLIVLLFALLAGGVWISITLGIVAWAGVAFFSSTRPEINLVTSTGTPTRRCRWPRCPCSSGWARSCSAPAWPSRCSAGLAPWLDRLPGRLLHVNVLGCGCSARCRVVGGHLRHHRQDLAARARAARLRRRHDARAPVRLGHAGHPDPPSIAMIVYAVASDVSIIRMFIAGVLPALLLLVLFSGYIAVWALLHPDRMPARAG